MKIWTLREKIPAGGVVAPRERLPWPQTIGIGMQHVIAMFGATFLVPLLTGFPPATTIFFSGIGTLLFLFVTRNRIPSYLGSSFAFISPVIAAKAGGGMAVALGGIIAAGFLLFLVGLLVKQVGVGWINRLMPPIVTGSIVALIGLNLAPVAKTNFALQPILGVVTLASIVLITVLFRGFAGRLSIFLGTLVGWVVAWGSNMIDAKAAASLQAAKWFGAPQFFSPKFTWTAIALIAPVVIVLIAENTGHVKAVAEMTGENLDDSMGKAYMADGLATMVAGAGGGSGTTTYAENIGVMAATRVYSTAAYAVAGLTAVLLGLCPKFGALILTMPMGVLGGVTTVLYGLIAVLGARIWVENKVNFHNSANLMTAAVALVIGAADYSWAQGKFSFNGIALGAFAAIATYQVMQHIGRRTGALAAAAEPATVAYTKTAPTERPVTKKATTPKKASSTPSKVTVSSTKTSTPIRKTKSTPKRKKRR
ncbi:MAG: solute carrier family 23 protein [Candidatus Saccharimonadales bacterium]